jgi:dihydrolipoamide dehydrogenase
MPDSQYDVAIIGGGPGGYVAAIRAAQLGMKVACVEKGDALGGTCLNVGCIPSKALLHSSERYSEARHEFGDQGIEVGEVKLDLGRMMARKDKIVGDLTKGVEFLFKKNKIDWVRGTGRITEPGAVAVDSGDGGSQTLAAKHIIVATGSESTPLPGVEIDEEHIVSSTGALSLPQVPQRLVVIGAGVIGLELGSVWSRLGASVTFIEFLDHILPGMDREIGKRAQLVFQKQGLTFKLSSKVTRAKVGKSAVVVDFEPAAGGDSERIEADVLLVCIGRRPYTEGLGLEALGVKTDELGRVEVDGRFQSAVPGIHAIGDCIQGPMLAHKAEEDGIACVEMLAGQSGHVDYNLVPAVVYTWPEIAAVGRTEEQLKEAGTEYRVGKFPFQANSRARTTGDSDGLVKILADAGNDRILGVHILGPIAGDLIMEAVVGMEFGASAEDIARTVHHHPGTGEAVKEAALAVDGRPIHI